MKTFFYFFLRKLIKSFQSRMPRNAAAMPKYGLGTAFREVGQKDHKVKKLFHNVVELDL